MKSTKILVAATLLLAGGFAWGQQVSREDRIAQAGGEIVKRGTFTGKVSIINAQTRLDASECEKVAQLFAKETKCNIVVDDGDGATIKLYVVDNPDEPIMLLAPEDRWGRVNVAKLVDDLPGEKAKQKFFAPRARKMQIKALSILMGGGSSQFPGNIMNAATMRDLDHTQENIPVDMVDNYVIYLKALGVKQAEYTTYKRACKEGWAPEPTNEVQKVIWEKVKAEQSESPSNPIRIKPGDKPKGK